MSVCRRKFEDKLADLVSPTGSNTFVLSRLLIDGIFDPAHPFTDEHLFKIAAAIKVNTTLKCFHLGSIEDPLTLNTLAWTEAGITAIGEALKDHPIINQINIDIRLTNSPTVPNSQLLGLLKALTGKAKIKELYIRVNVTEINFLNELAAALSANTSLEKLKLEIEPNLGTTYLAMHWENFAESIVNKKLLNFELSSTYVRDTVMNAIAPILSKIITLERLELTRCRIENESENGLSVMLGSYKKLRSLSLDYNYMTSAALRLLAPALSKMNDLRYLSLRNLISVAGGLESLVQVLRQLKVEVLEVDGTIYDPRSRPELISLITIPSIRELSVFTQILTDEEVASLSNPKICKLRRLYYRGPMGVTSHVAAQIKRIMDANPYLLKMGRKDHEPAHENPSRQALMRQQCIDYLIILASLFNGTQALPGINLVSFFPNDVKLIILKLILPVFMDIPTQETSELLFHSFNNRRTKVKNGEYIPKTKENNSDINSFWYKGAIFKTRSESSQKLIEAEPDIATANAIQAEIGVSLELINRKR